MYWSTSGLRGRLARRKNGLSPPVKYFTDRSKAVLLLRIFSCVCYAFRARLFIYAFVVTFPLVSWVRCGTWLYRFLIFAPLLKLLSNCKQNITSLSLMVGTTVLQSQEIVLSKHCRLGWNASLSCRILVPWVDLQCVSVACLDHAHLHFSIKWKLTLRETDSDECMVSKNQNTNHWRPFC